MPWAVPAKMRPTSSITPARSSSDSSISIFPASIFEKSKMSLMITNRLSAETFTPEASSACSLLRSVWSRSSVSPMTPFIGVRISWLIVETNCDLVRDATKAASRAATRSSAA